MAVDFIPKEFDGLEDLCGPVKSFYTEIYKTFVIWNSQLSLFIYFNALTKHDQLGQEHSIKMYILKHVRPTCATMWKLFFPLARLLMVMRIFIHGIIHSETSASFS